KHYDLCQPCNGVKEYDYGIVCTSLIVAHHQAGKIDREEPRRVHGIGESEDDQRAHRHEWSVQTLRQCQPVKHQGYDLAASDADDAAKNGIAQEGHQSMRPALFTK